MVCPDGGAPAPDSPRGVPLLCSVYPLVSATAKASAARLRVSLRRRNPCPSALLPFPCVSVRPSCRAKVVYSRPCCAPPFTRSRCRPRSATPVVSVGGMCRRWSPRFGSLPISAAFLRFRRAPLSVVVCRFLFLSAGRACCRGGVTRRRGKCPVGPAREVNGIGWYGRTEASLLRLRSFLVLRVARIRVLSRVGRPGVTRGSYLYPTCSRGPRGQVRVFDS